VSSIHVPHFANGISVNRGKSYLAQSIEAGLSPTFEGFDLKKDAAVGAEEGILPGTVASAIAASAVRKSN
jgi:hypothetical protein